MRARRMKRSNDISGGAGDDVILGGTVGGPIKKNRLFYFGGWERNKEQRSRITEMSGSITSSSSISVPSISANRDPEPT